MHIAGRERPPAGKPHGEVGVTAGETALTRMRIARNAGLQLRKNRVVVLSRVGVNIVLSPLCRRSPRSKMNGTTSNKFTTDIFKFTKGQT